LPIGSSATISDGSLAKGRWLRMCQHSLLRNPTPVSVALHSDQECAFVLYSWVL